jgi:hypothetical protein
VVVQERGWANKLIYCTVALMAFIVFLHVFDGYVITTSYSEFYPMIIKEIKEQR